MKIMQLISIMNLRNLSFPQYILIKYKFDGRVHVQES